MSNKSANAIQEIESPVMEPEADDLMNRRTEKLLEKVTNNLGERVKELNCLYGISRLVEKADISLDELIQGIVNLIPPAWQYPEITCAQIILEDQVFSTVNFKDTALKLLSDIIVDEKRIGSLKIGYIKERSANHERLFLKEERYLIDAISERLGRIIERIRGEQKLQNQSHILEERVKELNCLYGISRLVEKQEISVEGILQGTVDIIPPSWQYPDCACARIILRDREYQTVNFRETTWKQMSSINVRDEKIGTLEVCYLNNKPGSDKGTFLKEERILLNIIAERLGKIIERIEARETLQESEKRYRILTEKIADGVSLIQNGKIIFANAAFASLFDCRDVSQLIGKEAIDLVLDDFKKQFHKIQEHVELGDSHEGIFHGKCLSLSGREFWMEGNCAVITWNRDIAFLLTARDVTEAKLREIAVKEEAVQLQRENVQLRSTIKDRYRFGDIIGKSPAMLEVYENIISAAHSDTSVVVLGESGTGKELVARAIHDMSERHNKPFVAINCGAIPENLLEAEFFGYTKGAFTGAYKNKLGFFDLAHEGTLFLDEVGELALNMQVKLLRALEGGEFIPVGSAKAHKSNVRIIGATNKNLKNLVKQGLMREDFFFRIHIVPIYIPPLRERQEDIPLLVEHFIKSNCNGGKQPTITVKIMEALLNHHWPGNIRELQNVIHRLAILKKFDFIQELCTDSEELNGFSDSGLKQKKQALPDALKKLEKEMISEALHEAAWHRTKTASILGINRKTLFKKIKHYKLTPSSQIGGFGPIYGADGPNEISPFLQ